MIQNQETKGILDGCYPQIDLNKVEDKRAVAICSGGLDSTSAMCRLIDEGFDVTLMYFLYGSKAESAERYACKHIAQFLKIKLELAGIHYLGQLGGSPLTDPSIPVPETGRETDVTMEAYVVNRNSIFVMLAAAYAERHGIPIIVMGQEAGEQNYGDHMAPFIGWSNNLLRYSCLRPPLLIAPNFFWQKRDEVRYLNAQHPALLSMTWSCDRSEMRNGEYIACGQCGCDFSRRRALAMEGIYDPQSYLADIDLHLDENLEMEEEQALAPGAFCEMCGLYTPWPESRPDSGRVDKVCGTCRRMKEIRPLLGNYKQLVEVEKRLSRARAKVGVHLPAHPLTREQYPYTGATGMGILISK